MRILHILNHSLPVVDGYSMRSQQILVHQRRQGLDAFALTSPKQEIRDGLVEEIRGVRFYRTDYREAARGISSRPLIKEGLVVRQLHRRLHELLRAERVEVLHAHSPSLNVIAAYLIGRRLRLPVVYEMRSLWEERPEENSLSLCEKVKYLSSRRVETFFLQRVDAVTTISHGLKRELMARGVPEDKVWVMPNGVDATRFTPRPAPQHLRRTLGLEKCFVVGFIGSFSYWEGLDLLVRAMKGVLSQRPDVRLLLVGNDEDQRFKRLADSLGLSDAVTFAGKVEPERIADYYAVMDLCVYPRTKMRLTELVTPLKPLEAMASAKVVLASDVGGHKELIDHGVTGFLFQAGSETELTRKIVELASSSSDHAAIRENARRMVRDNRDWDRIVARYEEVYQLVLERR